jgi:type IV fimbrial biogenesis protein FimT
MMSSDRRHTTKPIRGSDSRGVTLVELMIALTVLGVLLALAVPSFRDAALNSSLRAISSNLYASVQLARGEAIKRNVPITLCRANTTGTACDVDSDWAAGWIVVASGTVLQYQQPVTEGFKVTQSGTAADLTFQPIGVGATAGTFTVCRSSPVGNQERVVSITATGNAYVTSTEAGVCP